MSHKRVLVVGTTPDYVDIINRRFPGRALFLTDARQRQGATEPTPDQSSELLLDLQSPQLVERLLQEHLSRYQSEISGVTCFDCESLALAAELARMLGLPFVSRQAVRSSRNKYLSKIAWRQSGVSCPVAALGSRISDAESFLKTIGGAIVIKPLTGSGSELVFVCRDINDSFRAVRKLKGRLARHPDQLMYPGGPGKDDQDNAREFFVMEEFIGGREYSADFVVDKDLVNIIRIAAKIPAVGQSNGTTSAYIVPAELPATFELGELTTQLRDAVKSLDIKRAICMVDFIIRDEQPYLLELTPRIGGDCLPPLIMQSCGLDMLELALDFAEGKSTPLPAASRWTPLVGLRLFAQRSGVIAHLDANELERDPRVREVYLKRRAGYRVVMPPEDYDSRLLGHVIFRPYSWNHVEQECGELFALLGLQMETSSWTAPILY